MSRHPVQYKNKCYCQKPCSCTSISLAKAKKTRPNAPKFVKFKDESWKSRPCPPAPSPLSMKSLYSRLSTTESSGRISSLSSLHMLRPSELESDSGSLTERRQYYEKLRDLLRHEKQTLEELAQSERSVLETIDEERIQRINEFRLQNSDDCFNLLRQYSAERRLRAASATPKPENTHICEYRFRKNERGLLEPIKDINGKIICEICRKVTDNQMSNTFTPMGTAGPQKLILEVRDSSDQKPNPIGKKKHTKPIVPANSLALRFQQRI